MRQCAARRRAAGCAWRSIRDSRPRGPCGGSAAAMPRLSRAAAWPPYSRCAAKRPTTSTSPSTPRTRRMKRNAFSARRSPASSGRSSHTSTTSTPRSARRVCRGAGDPIRPPPPQRHFGRNARWRHLNSMRILAMPDTWEYPWFAAWDLAFHAVVYAIIDAHFAKEQLWLMLFEQFQHPNGQIPAYEWEFADLNPPVHAWAVWRVYNMDRIRSGRADRAFLEKCFHKLMLNFAWWVNKVDREGNNIFEGGFLGLDNITVIDRSEKMAGGVVLEQSDATGWMGMFCLNLMRIAIELSKENPVYEGLATKFFEHYVYVGAAMKHRGGREYSLWDERDEFFYDVLRYPNGEFHKFRVRSLVGIISLYA